MIARFANQLYMNIFLWFCHFWGVFVLKDYCSLGRVLCHHLNDKELLKKVKKEDRKKELLSPLTVFC